jgi:DNA-binding protein H-NS
MADSVHWKFKSIIGTDLTSSDRAECFYEQCRVRRLCGLSFSFLTSYICGESSPQGLSSVAREITTQSEPNLNSMSIDELIALRQEVSESLDERVTEQRRSLELELAKLNRFRGGTPRSKSPIGKSSPRSSVGTPVEPKYRNPENPGETWAGRGLKPRWLKAAIEAGKSADDFLISHSVQPKKTDRRITLRKAQLAGGLPATRGRPKQVPTVS